MSTKISDAYKFALPAGKTLVSFCKEISGRYLDKAFGDYCEKIARETVRIYEELVIRRYVSPPSYIRMRDELIEKAGIPLAKNRTREETLQGYDPVELAIMITNHDMREAEKFEPAINNPALAVFDAPESYDGPEYLMMSFGRLLSDMLDDLEADNKPGTFAREYNLREYGWQNQTDKPDGVSDAEWKEREYAWDSAMPSGIASRDGMVVDICSRMRLMTHVSLLEYGKDQDKPRAERPIESKVRSFLETDERYSSPERRIESYARAIASERYVTSSPEYDPKDNNTGYRLAMEFLGKLDERDPDAISRYGRALTDIEYYFEERRNGDKSVDINKLLEPLRLE